MYRADNRSLQGRIGIGSRFLAAGLLTVALALMPAFATAATGAVGSTRGRLTVSVVGVNRATGPVCLTLRDLTENMVVGSYCDGDVTDLNSTRGRILLDLPRRSFAVDAGAPGAKIESVSPRRFDLRARQTVVVRLARIDNAPTS